MAWARGYLAKITTRLQADDPERVPLFKHGATQLVKLIAGKFDEMQLFAGKKMDYEGAFCFAYQKDQEDENLTFLFFADGLKGIYNNIKMESEDRMVENNQDKIFLV